MTRSPVFVIGASSGGVNAVHSLVAGLHPGFAQSMFIVLHIGAWPSMLPHILTSAGPLPAKHAQDNELIRPRQIYIAPPDRHMLIHNGRVCVNRDPEENGTRPAIDPLFRSAAQSLGPAAVGVILSGSLNDGTSGLQEIKLAGGIAIVQDPLDAEFPQMPTSAAANVKVDYCLPLADIPGLLSKLADRY